MSDFKGLSPRFQDALIYALGLHNRQRRRVSGIPYFSHLMAVTALVLEDGGDEDQAIAALLHDAVEDQGGEPTRKEVHARFGERVGRIVDACTDPHPRPEPPWRERKMQYLEQLKNAPEEALRVALADKLHNLKSLLRDHEIHGDDLWKRFNAGKDDQVWFFESFFAIVKGRFVSPFLAEFGRRLEEFRDR